MSWQACDWADKLEYDKVGPLAFRVLIKLANVAAEDGTRAFRSKATMAHELGVSQRSIQRALRELEYAALILPGNQEFVRHIRSDRRPTVYDLNFGYKREFAQPELAQFDGETEFSTEASGETPEVQPGRQLLSHKERSVNTLNSSTKGDHSTRAQVKQTCPNGHRIIATSGSGVPFCDLGCAPWDREPAGELVSA